MIVLVTCKYEEDPIKNEDTRVLTRFSLWELSVAMETRVPIRSGQKPNAAFSPIQMMLWIKFGCNRSTGLRDINV